MVPPTQGGPVTSLAFRTDAGAGSGAGGETATMASGAADGRVWLWDLGERNLRGELAGGTGGNEGAHSAAAVISVRRGVVGLRVGSE